MYLRPCFRQKDGTRHAYCTLVESHRTVRRPRQRVVSYLGEMDAQGRAGVRAGAEGKYLYELFEPLEPEWVEVDVKRVTVVRKRELGGAWLALEMCHSLGLPEFLAQIMKTGREDIPWPVMVLVLVIGRVGDPSSELHLAEHSFAASARALGSRQNWALPSAEAQRKYCGAWRYRTNLAYASRRRLGAQFRRF